MERIKDYIVTWAAGNKGAPVKEGFTKLELSKYKGNSNLERIQECFRTHNESIPKSGKREILSIIEIKKTIIFVKL